MSMVGRLIFGSARLKAGPYSRASQRLIETCLAAGLRAFDTAPPYGMGSAEGLIGAVTAGMEDVAVHGKIGLPRPSHPGLRCTASWLKRLLRRDHAGGATPVMHDHAGRAPYGDYAPDALQRSLDTSLKLLRRDSLDALLLHEAEPDEVGDTAWAVLEQAQASGRAKAIGFAHNGPPKSAMAGLITQVAPRPADFLVGGDALRIFHSIHGARRIAEAALSEFAGQLRDVRAAAGLRDSDGGATFAAVVILARLWPNARFIYATTSQHRLEEMLDMAVRP